MQHVHPSFALLASIVFAAQASACVIIHAQTITQFPSGTGIYLQVWDNDVEVCHGQPDGDNATAGGGDVRRLDCGNGAWVEMTGQGAQLKYHSSNGYEYPNGDAGSAEKDGPHCTSIGGDPGDPNFSQSCSTYFRNSDNLGCDAYPQHPNCQKAYCG